MVKYGETFYGLNGAVCFAFRWFGTCVLSDVVCVFIRMVSMVRYFLFLDIIPVSILHKSEVSRYRPANYPDGPITTRYRFIKNASWALSHLKNMLGISVRGHLLPRRANSRFRRSLFQIGCKTILVDLTT